jgi:methylenetetrahydrofolate reductase (NADPH)
MDDVVGSPPRDPEHMITAHGAADSVTHGFVDVPTTENGHGGKGEVVAAATWDEFPNGRFGDFKSPAYGDLDQWGGSTLSVR